MAEILGGLLDLSTYVDAVCRFIATVGAALIVVAVITWGVVEDETWTLREAIRVVSACALMLAILGVLVVGALVMRKG